MSVFESTQHAAPSAVEEWFEMWQPVEPLATAGSVTLWRVASAGGGSALVRLYPRLQRADALRRFGYAAVRRVKLDSNPQVLPVARMGTHGRPHLLLSDPVGEPLATRIEREPLPPQVALRVFEDVAAGLDALARAGVPPVDLSPADVFLAGDRGLLLADTGLLVEALRGRCLDLEHSAPERVATARRRDDGPIGQALARLDPRQAPRPTTASMAYSFASLLREALVGPAEAGSGSSAAMDFADLPAAVRRVLDQALARRFRRRHRTPSQIVGALRAALGEPTTPTQAAVAPRRPARGLGRRNAAAIGAVVVAAGVAGAAVGATTTAPDPQAPATLSSNGLSVQAPAGWASVSGADAPFGAGSGALVARPTANPRAGLTVTRSGGPLLARAAGTEPSAVELRGGDAWHYAGLRLGASAIDLYVLDTTAGPVFAACHAAAAAAAARELLATCGGSVRTLRAAGARAVPLGGEPAARTRLADALTALSRRRASGRRTLAAADTRPAQAAVANDLARAYASSGKATVANGSVGSPGSRARLAAGLAATGRAYAALGAAARRGDAAAYGVARRQIEQRERALRGAIAATSARAAGD